MPRFEREIVPVLKRAARAFPAVVLTGPRRAGKTYCLTHTLPGATYRLLEDPDVLMRVRADPRGFLDGLRTPVILDEIQNAPELLPYVRTRIDGAPSQKGKWWITGSQDFSLMQGVTESMAGRAAIFQLRPLSLRETGKCDLLKGGYPEVWLRPRSAGLWFRSYLQTYLERDVRSVTAVHDLALFRRFLALLATRNATPLNKTELAAPLGVSVPTIAQWLSVLQTTGVILLVPPYFENLGKRLVKTPKLYFGDTGLLCHLLGIESNTALERSALVGGVFEAFIASELQKQKLNRGDPADLYYFRDHQGLELDFLVPERGGKLLLLEAKYSRTVVPSDARAIEALLPRFRRGARGLVVHRASSATGMLDVLAPGVKAVTIEELFA